MKVRLIAGLGMTLLAAGLMIIYFLNPNFPGVGSGSSLNEKEPTTEEGIKDTQDEIAEFLGVPQADRDGPCPSATMHLNPARFA